MSDVYYDAAIARYEALKTAALEQVLKTDTQQLEVQPLIAEEPEHTPPQIPQPYPQVP